MSSFSQLCCCTGQLVNKKVTVLKAAEPHMQGFPEGWTESIHPLAGSYVSKVQEEASDKASETSAAYRFRAIANAVTVEVRISDLLVAYSSLLDLTLDWITSIFRHTCICSDSW